jgi:SWIM zinc finger
MSRPRKPFGANHPGRLPATMMKVLAAEMSDPSRLRRGKQYAKDGSVLDIVIEPGVVTCEIQGSRSTPYIAAVEVSPGDGMPLRRDIRTNCTCPDDDNWDGYACKHVVAAMFTLSDEFLLQPELLDLWRNRTTTSDDRFVAIVSDEPDVSAGGGRHLRLVRSGDADPRRDETRRAVPPADPLEALLRVPTGARLPDLPDIDRIEPVMPKSRALATVLRDAISNLRIDWD